MPPTTLPNVLVFWPEAWGEAERFAQLHTATHQFNELERRFVAGVGAHFNKAMTLEALASKLRPNLEIDRQQLEERGHTPASNSTELAAVIEAGILELYSTVDCVAKVIFAIYGKKHIRGLKQSTRGLFKGFNKITGEFPEEIKAILRTATWYDDLRTIRDELVHRQTGVCNLDHQTNVVSYVHLGMRSEGRAFIIEDIFAWFREKRDAVNFFLGPLYQYLNSQLSPTPIHVVCGMTQGRILMRSINPTEKLTFDSGQCMSYRWFQQPGNPGCPFSERCGAYKRMQGAVPSVQQ